MPLLMAGGECGHDGPVLLKDIRKANRKTNKQMKTQKGNMDVENLLKWVMESQQREPSCRSNRVNYCSNWPHNTNSKWLNSNSSNSWQSWPPITKSSNNTWSSRWWCFYNSQELQLT